MIEGSFGGPEDEDEGAIINVNDGRYIVVRLVGKSLVIEIHNSVYDDAGVECAADELEFNLAEARVIARAINKRVM